MGFFKPTQWEISPHVSFLRLLTKLLNLTGYCCLVSSQPDKTPSSPEELWEHSQTQPKQSFSTLLFKWWLCKFHMHRFNGKAFNLNSVEGTLFTNQSICKGRYPKKRDFLGIFPRGGGGSSRFPKLLKINQVIFGMPKSLLGAKTCFTIVGRWYLINLIT